MSRSMKMALLSVALFIAFVVPLTAAQDLTIRVDTTLAGVAGGVLAGFAWAFLGYLASLKNPIDPATGKPPVFQPTKLLRTVGLGAVLGFFIDFTAPLSADQIETALFTLFSTAGVLPILQKTIAVGQMVNAKLNPPAQPPA